MAAGMRVRDPANGNIIIDITDRLTRILGYFPISSPGSLVNPELANGTPWVMIIDPLQSYSHFSQPLIPRFSGTTLLWEQLNGPNIPVRSGWLLYGLY